MYFQNGFFYRLKEDLVVLKFREDSTDHAIWKQYSDLFPQPNVFPFELVHQWQALYFRSRTENPLNDDTRPYTDCLAVRLLGEMSVHDETAAQEINKARVAVQVLVKELEDEREKNKKLQMQIDLQTEPVVVDEARWLSEQNAGAEGLANALLKDDGTGHMGGICEEVLTQWRSMKTRISTLEQMLAQAQAAPSTPTPTRPCGCYDKQVCDQCQGVQPGTTPTDVNAEEVYEGWILNEPDPYGYSFCKENAENRRVPCTLTIRKVVPAGAQQKEPKRGNIDLDRLLHRLAYDSMKKGDRERLLKRVRHEINARENDLRLKACSYEFNPTTGLWDLKGCPKCKSPRKEGLVVQGAGTPPADQAARDNMQKLLESEERLRVQLAGCLTAAEGHVPNPALRQGDYAWTLAYQKTLDLHRSRETVQKELTAYVDNLMWVRKRHVPGVQIGENLAVHVTKYVKHLEHVLAAHNLAEAVGLPPVAPKAVDRWSDGPVPGFESFSKVSEGPGVKQPEGVVSFSNGAVASSMVPAFHLIPTRGLVALANRFMTGVQRKGNRAWNAVSPNQHVLTDTAFIRDRLDHVIKHTLNLRDNLLKGTPSPSDDDDAAAIAWGGVFAVCAVAALQDQQTRKGD